MRVEKLLKRLRREFIKVNLIQAALDSLLVFLSVNLLLFLLNFTLVSESLHYRVLTGLTLVFLLVDWVNRSRKYSLEIYEEENPQLQEILRTARDNLDNQNIVSQAMFDDLMDRARTVTSESIIPSTEIIQKILVIGFLSFLTALSGIVDFQVQKESQQIFSQLDPEQLLEDEKKVLKNASEIYGEKRSIDAVSTDLRINVTGNAEGQGSVETGSVDGREFAFHAADPGMPEDVRLARRYSLAISEMD